MDDVSLRLGRETRSNHDAGDPIAARVVGRDFGARGAVVICARTLCLAREVEARGRPKRSAFAMGSRPFACWGKLERRAVQLGLRGALLCRFVEEALAVEDISGFVAEQRPRALGGNWDELLVPRERVYPVENLETARRLGLDVAG